MNDHSNLKCAVSKKQRLADDHARQGVERDPCVCLCVGANPGGSCVHHHSHQQAAVLLCCLHQPL